MTTVTVKIRARVGEPTERKIENAYASVLTDGTLVVSAMPENSTWKFPSLKVFYAPGTWLGAGEERGNE